MNQAVKQFFDHYEQANATSDVTSIAKLYADTFMFAGVNGAQAVKKEDFLKVIPKMKAHFVSIGLTKTELHSVQASTINAKYFLANTEWRMTVVDSKGCARQVKALATYVLEQKANGTLAIVFQIDHQDLATVVNDQRTTTS
ncbi:MAG TPA: hypothetical protein VFU50_16405 [Terriglobales bacterium]|nr:hypothetical protein [Terriglobales bacterium]